MGTIKQRNFVSKPEEAEQGVPSMTKEEIITSLIQYKKQNPAKYEAKKEALFKRYGLNDIPAEVEDEMDKELEEAKKKVKKLNIV